MVFQSVLFIITLNVILFKTLIKYINKGIDLRDSTGFAMGFLVQPACQHNVNKAGCAETSIIIRI